MAEEGVGNGRKCLGWLKVRYPEMPCIRDAGIAPMLSPAQPVRQSPFPATSSESVSFCCRGASRAVDTEISTRPRLRAATDGVRYAGLDCPFGGRRRKRERGPKQALLRVSTGG